MELGDDDRWLTWEKKVLENLYISQMVKASFSFIYIIKPSSALEDVLDVARLVCLFFRARTDKTRKSVCG